MHLTGFYFEPDFEVECRICGTSPCVKVLNHEESETELCGICFFQNDEMLDWENWNSHKFIVVNED